MVISADHVLGLPTSMVTMTQNDSSPELLAHARRGPCAQPRGDELFEYLLTRRAPTDRRADVQQDPAAATLSFERRNYAQKHDFCDATIALPSGSAPTPGTAQRSKGGGRCMTTRLPGTRDGLCRVATSHGPRSLCARGSAKTIRKSLRPQLQRHHR